MPQLNNNETYTVRGDMNVASGTLTLRAGQINRSNLVQEDLSQLGVDLTKCTVHDDLDVVLAGVGGTPSANDLGLIAGTWGTDAPTLQTEDLKAAGATTEYARFQIPITNDYVLDETLQIRIRAGMVTTVSDTTATVDLEVYFNDGDGAAATDLCSTAAQSMNSLTKANLDFTLTDNTISHGDILDCRVAVAINDGATGTVVIGEISAIKLIRDIKG